MVDKPKLDIDLDTDVVDIREMMRAINAVEKKFHDKQKPYDRKGAWNDWEQNQRMYDLAKQSGIPGAKKKSLDLESYGDASRFNSPDEYQDKTGIKADDTRGCKILVKRYVSKLSGGSDSICIEQSPEEALAWKTGKK